MEHGGGAAEVTLNIGSFDSAALRSGSHFKIKNKIKCNYPTLRQRKAEG